jgi:hypothetical protein
MMTPKFLAIRKSGQRRRPASSKRFARELSRSTSSAAKRNAPQHGRNIYVRDVGGAISGRRRFNAAASWQEGHRSLQSLRLPPLTSPQTSRSAPLNSLVQVPSPSTSSKYSAGDVDSLRTQNIIWTDSESEAEENEGMGET